MEPQVLNGVEDAQPLQDITLEPLQFRLTQSRHPGAISIGDYWLSRSPDLPVTKVFDQAGLSAGLLLGFPIDLARSKALRGTWVLPDGADVASDQGRHTALLGLGGAFLWICVVEGCARIYPDAGTQVSCVWDAATRSAGSTGLAILEDADYLRRFDHDQFAQLKREGGGWFPAGLTAHSGVTRLLPNHYLDLPTWSARRFDLTSVMAGQSVDDCIEGVIADVRAQFQALAHQPRPCAVALTAGYQTRALLACARDWIDQVTFVTVDGTGRQNADTVIASLLAAEQVLTHRVLPRVEATRQQQQTYLRRSGHCVADGNLRWHPSLAPMAKDHVFIGGIGGAIGQVDPDGADQMPSVDGILARLGMSGADKTKRYLRHWLNRLGHAPADRVLGLAYLENYLGPGPLATICADPALRRFAPFLTYRNVAAMQSLPLIWRRDNTLAKEIVARQWPALSRYPYNTPGPQRPAEAEGVLKRRA